VARGDRGMEPVDELGLYVKSAIRNYGNESNYLYGIKAGAPRIVKLLQRYDARASWAAAAMSLEKHPDLARAIADLGHEVVAHGYRWVHQFKMDEAQERAFIRQAVTSIEQSVGVRPYGWLSRYLHTDNTRRLLVEEGFEYHMDDYSGDIPFWDKQTVADKPIAIVPYQIDSNDMKMWTDPAMTPTMWLDYAKNCFDQLYREGEEGNPKMMSLGLHLRIIGRAGRIWALEEFLRHVRSKQDVWIASRRDIAQHLAVVNPL
jgi:allantoinase